MWEAETENISRGGCLIVTPRPLAVGTLVRLTLSAERIGEPLVVTGQVAWVENGRPARAGIAFAGSSTDAPGPAAWVQSLAAAEVGRVHDAAPGVSVALPSAPELDMVVAPPEPEDASPTALASRLAGRAEELLRSGHARPAEVLLRRALAIAPGDPRLELLLADAAACCA
jgi:hypothetical protein